MSTQTLEACPWCGTTPQLTRGIETSNVVIFCGNLGCCAKPRVDAVTVELATLGWNTRKVPVNEELDVKAVEKRTILKAFDKFAGNRVRMAQALGLGYRTLSGKLRSYGFAPRAREKPGQEVSPIEQEAPCSNSQTVSSASGG